MVLTFLANHTSNNQKQAKEWWIHAKQRQEFQLPGSCLSGPTNLFIFGMMIISNVSNHQTNERKLRFFEKRKNRPLCKAAVIKDIYYIQVIWTSSNLWCYTRRIFGQKIDVNCKLLFEFIRHDAKYLVFQQITDTLAHIQLPSVVLL